MSFTHFFPLITLEKTEVLIPVQTEEFPSSYFRIASPVLPSTVRYSVYRAVTIQTHVGSKYPAPVRICPGPQQAGKGLR